MFVFSFTNRTNDLDRPYEGLEFVKEVDSLKEFYHLIMEIEKARIAREDEYGVFLEGGIQVYDKNWGDEFEFPDKGYVLRSRATINDQMADLASW